MTDRYHTLLIVASHHHNEAIGQKLSEDSGISVMHSDNRSLIGRRFKNILITRDAWLEMSVPQLSSPEFVDSAQHWYKCHVMTRLVRGGHVIHI